jgi:AcrR family transcriptional regulator
MPKPKSVRDARPLTAADWENAALAALERGGASAVSVEAIARELGSTKGSFYWHFANREALLSAALVRWEDHYTEAVIKALEALTSPRDKLARLIRSANASESSWKIHVALGASTKEPVVALALARVSKRRIAYIEVCYRALGSTKEVARQQALLAYASYLGFLRLRVEAPAEVPTAAGRDGYLDSVVEALVPST